MNTELKALISTAFDVEKLVEDTMKKNYYALIADSLAIMADMPANIAGFQGLQDEIKGLTNPANEADLVAYLQMRFSSIQVLSSARAKAVIAAMINLITAALAVEQAFVS